MTRDQKRSTDRAEGISDLTIAVIGGGSREWVPKIVMDLAVSGDLSGEVRLHDVDEAAAKRNERFGNWVNEREEARSHWEYGVYSDRADALRGAEFVLTSTQYDPADTNVVDLRVPKEYGIVQPVTHSVGPGGHARSMRQLPVYREIAADVREHCPDAWVFNYTNPMTTVTRALYEEFPEINALGFCHEVFGTQEHLAELVAEYEEIDGIPDRDEIEVDVSGINHFTWITEARWRGRDLLSLVDRHIERPGVIREYASEELADESYFIDNNQITYELYRRFGVLPAAGDRHLAEFAPWFVRGSDKSGLNRWGIRRTPASYREKHWTDVESWQDFGTERAMADPDGFSLERSNEVTVECIRALCGIEPFVTNVNLPNEGQAPDLPRGAVVETNARLSADSVTRHVAGKLPRPVRTLVRTHVGNQETLVAAAVDGDLDLAFQAFLNDPQVMGLKLDDARDMFVDLVTAHREYLTDWDFDADVLNR